MSVEVEAVNYEGMSLEELLDMAKDMIGDVFQEDVSREDLIEELKAYDRLQRNEESEKYYKDKGKINIIEESSNEKKGSVEKKSDYQGWTNYETWHIALMVDNSPGDIEYWNERIEELIGQVSGMDMVKDNILPADKAPVYKLAEEIKEWLEDIAAEYELPAILTGLLRAGMDEIDYTELAESWVSDYKENKEYEMSKQEGVKTESKKETVNASIMLENSGKVLDNEIEENVHYSVLERMEKDGRYIPVTIKWAHAVVDDFSDLDKSKENKKKAEEYILEQDLKGKSLFDK